VKFVVIERQLFRDADTDVLDFHPFETAGAIFNQFYLLLQLGVVEKRRVAFVERADRVRASNQK
jgi:hypothetical protein